MSLEERKTKSRLAAQNRRTSENKEFQGLAKLLPLQTQISLQLDKASIIRLSIAFLKLKELLDYVNLEKWKRKPFSVLKNCNNDQLTHSIELKNLDCPANEEAFQILQSSEAFLFILSRDARITFISETVSSFLGLSQVELIGNTIFYYIHEDDCNFLATQLGLNYVIHYEKHPNRFMNTNVSNCSYGKSGATVNERMYHSFSLRMKCTLTKRGPNIKSSGFRTVRITGKFLWKFDPTKNSSEILGFVGIGWMPPISSHNTEILLRDNHFVLKLSQSLIINYCDPKASSLCGWSQQKLIGKSLYELVHPQDLQYLAEDHKQVLEKHQWMFHPIRLTDDPLYIDSRSSVCDIYGVWKSKSSEEQFILLLIEIIGSDEQTIEYYDHYDISVQCFQNGETSSFISEKNQYFACDFNNQAEHNFTSSANLRCCAEANELALRPFELQKEFYCIQNRLQLSNAHDNSSGSSDLDDSKNSDFYTPSIEMSKIETCDALENQIRISHSCCYDFNEQITVEFQDTPSHQDRLVTQQFGDYCGNNGFSSAQIETNFASVNEQFSGVYNQLCMKNTNANSNYASKRNDSLTFSDADIPFESNFIFL